MSIDVVLIVLILNHAHFLLEVFLGSLTSCQLLWRQILNLIERRTVEPTAIVSWGVHVVDDTVWQINAKLGVGESACKSKCEV